jgi:glycosyltransferase involved in cell wall biosynthesis
MTTETNRNESGTDLSLVIAAHNEVGTIADVVCRARDVIGVHAEIIVVDDGSTDGTRQAALDTDARVVHLWPNRGKGKALRAGVAQTSGRWVIFLDGDGQDDPADIPRLLQAATDDVIMVNGSRFLGSLREGAINGPNRIGNIALTWLMSVLFGHRITDSQAGFRVFRGDVVRNLSLRSTEYEIETEMLAKVLRRGHRVVEVPVTRYQRGGGHTDFRRVRNGLRILGTMLRERFA